MTTTGIEVVTVLAQRGSFLVPSLWLAGALLVAAMIIALISRWRKQGEEVSPGDQLSQFRSLYEQGAITEEEYSRLRGILGGEIRRKAGVEEKRTPGKGGMKPPSAEQGSEETGIQPG